MNYVTLGESSLPCFSGQPRQDINLGQRRAPPASPTSHDSRSSCGCLCWSDYDKLDPDWRKYTNISEVGEIKCQKG